MANANTPPAFPADHTPTPCGGYIDWSFGTDVCSVCGNRCYEDAELFKPMETTMNNGVWVFIRDTMQVQDLDTEEIIATVQPSPHAVPRGDMLAAAPKLLAAAKNALAAFELVGCPKDLGPIWFPLRTATQRS